MRTHDVIIIGSGSGNSLLTPEYDHLDVALIDGGTFGGTCLNVGCIPTKMYVYPAETTQSARELTRLGVTVDTESAKVDWPSIRDRIFGRIDAISSGGLDYRKSLPNVTVYQEYARFTGPKTLVTASGTELTAPVIVVASGSRVTVPEIPGVDLPAVHTSDTVMRIPDLPKRVVVVGGGYIAAEFASIFHGLGSRVQQLNRSGRVLRSHDRDIAERFQACAQAQWDLDLGWTPTEITPNDDGSVTVHSRRTDRSANTPGTNRSDDRGETVQRRDVADLVLLATGRRPNTDLLDTEAAGLGVDAQTGLLAVDEYQRVLDTSGDVVDGVWALGDICSPAQLKHVANQEARVVAHNALHPEALQTSDHRYIPAAVFTHPEIATVGMTEEQARDWAQRHHTEISVKVQAFGDVAYGWAMDDQTGICKVIAERATGRLLGAHLIGPHSSILIQPLIQAMSFGLSAQEMARGQYWIHPALAEVVENALLGLDLD